MKVPMFYSGIPGSALEAFKACLKFWTKILGLPLVAGWYDVDLTGRIPLCFRKCSNSSEVN